MSGGLGAGGMRRRADSPPAHAVKKQVTICDSAMQAALGAEGIVVATGASFLLPSQPRLSLTTPLTRRMGRVQDSGLASRVREHGQACVRRPCLLSLLCLPPMADPLRDSYSFVFDGRGILDADKLKAIGFKVFTIGRGEEI